VIVERLRADRGRRPRATSLSDRAKRILALEELHAIGILRSHELVAELRSATDPQLIEPDVHRRMRRSVMAEEDR